MTPGPAQSHSERVERGPQQGLNGLVLPNFGMLEPIATRHDGFSAKADAGGLKVSCPNRERVSLSSSSRHRTVNRHTDYAID
jgi:hypothetical protein